MSALTPPRLSLAQLKKQAKEVLKAHHSGDPGACPVLRRLPRFAAAMAPEILAAEVGLSDVQFALAREHGFESWAHLKRHVEGLEPRPKSELKQEGSARWITQVPKVGWGLDRDCTCMGCLEAALAATDDPWSYPDLMAFSGLAFRIRWSPEFCPSCAVGEMPDEGDGIGRCAGIVFPTDVQFGQENPDREPIRRRIVGSIDAGKPILAYGICLDVSVIYGYEDDGRCLWLTDYHAKGQMPYKLPLEKLGPWQAYLEKRHEAPPPQERLRLSLALALTNWQRREHDGGIPGRRYLYGPAAYDGWLEAIRQAEQLPADRLKGLHHTHGFVWMTLADARQAAAKFLNDYAEFATPKASDSLRNAAGHCAAEAKRLYLAFDQEKLFTGPLAEWTAVKRKREAEIIEGMRHQDGLLHVELKQALATVGAQHAHGTGVEEE